MSVTGVEVYYGDYQFKPAPLMTVSREQYKANNGTVFGGGYRVSINGSLLPEHRQKQLQGQAFLSRQDTSLTAMEMLFLVSGRKMICFMPLITMGNYSQLSF